MFKKIVCLLSVFAFSQTALSAPSLSTKVHNHYNSMRALGMGNAFVGLADDYSLIFYNPAGFAKKKQNEIQISLIGAGMSPKITDLMKDVKDASDTQGTDNDKAVAVSNVLEKYYGKNLGAKIQALELFWIRKNWGAAILPMDLTIDMSIERELGPAIDLNVKGDTTFAFGYGKELENNISVGATAKLVHRVSVEESVSALDLATNPDVLSKDRFREGQTVDFDLGVLWSPAWFGRTLVKEEKTDGLKVESVENKARDPQAEKKKDAKKEAQSAKKEAVKPEPPTDLALDAAAMGVSADTTTPKVEEKPVAKETYVDHLPLQFGAVVRNVLGGNFMKSKLINKDATEAPTKMHRVIDVGSSYHVTQFGDLSVRGMADVRNILHPEINLNKSLHLGVELDYSPYSMLRTQFRAGLNQMYYTAGATLLFGVLNLDFVTYGEEVGTQSKRVEDRVYAVKVALNW